MERHRATIHALADYLQSANVIQDAAYNALWNKGKIKYSNNKIIPDLIDELNTRLSTSTITQKGKTLIVFPDRKEQRGPLLFSITIVLDYLRLRRNNHVPGSVLYFGATVGIRQHLSEVYIHNLCLGTVFPQSSVGKTQKQQRNIGRSSDLHLPTVLTIYSPSDPVELCERYKPGWIAIDCRDKNQLRWIEPLLEHAKHKSLPVIGWLTNPLSNLIEVFQRNDSTVLCWPQLNDAPSRGIDITSGLELIFDTREAIDIQPIIIEAENDNPLRELLLHVYRSLAKLTKQINSSGGSRLRLERISISVAWKVLRIMEGLSVPLELYETESKNIWGISSLSDLLKTMNAYLENLQNLSVGTHTQLQEIYNTLQTVHHHLQTQPPPLWNILIEMCIEQTTEVGRMFVFPSISAKNLFSLALLSYYNITEDDLIELGVRLTSLKQLYEDLTQPDDTIGSLDLRTSVDQYVLVGLPNHHNSAFMQPLLKQNFTIVLLDYQLSSFKRKLDEWGRWLFPVPTTCASSVADTLGLSHKHGSDDSGDGTVVHRLMEPIQATITYEGSKIHTRESSYPLRFEEYDVVQELNRLMQDDDADGLNSDYVTHSHQPADVGQMVDKAWDVEFTNGNHIFFASDDMVNVIAEKNGKTTTDERFVSSLRSGDKILYISGQSRQSLFDLLVSRVYDNPAISLHVKLVERWHEELVKAYNQRKRLDSSWSLDKLFEEMRLRGTKISDSQPLRYWLKGDTLRPQDAEDLRRLAEIFNLEFIKQHYKRIHRAGGRLHGLHVSLSRRLNSWIQDGTPDLFAETSGNDDLVDEELGLTLRDFMNSVRVLAVKGKSLHVGPFLRNTLGQIESSSKVLE
ncbi:DrmE family protein [Oscillatoria laete-virens NRMC-F 0139]|nr:DrmE family protein [Oscillatoria laete-virens]MDL5054910.1 DrmE family protein [Oscillatoria laete-virens NRMC-F 0139]